ncbi:MAG TPA: histidine kinase [Micromonosporaceae bacterium]|nr:histidine kinase [Micromonosporaceae bacterium]
MQAASLHHAVSGPANEARIRRWRFGWVWGAIWLIYLGYPLRDAWHHDSGAVRGLGVAAVVAFGIGYVALFIVLRQMRRRLEPVRPVLAWAAIAGMLALTALAAPAAGESALGLFVYIGVMAMFLLPLRLAMAVLVGLVGASEVLSRTVPGWTAQDFLAFQIFVAALAAWGFTQLLRTNVELVAAQAEIARLAVADERNRFARDLHDLLGHSLTVVAVKAELAGRLMEIAPERAAAEIADVERLARQALGDVRAAVAGYREGTLAAELASAHAALTAAGIEAVLDVSSLDDIPAERQPLFRWVTREGVTNAIRHSQAKRCTIRVYPDGVEVIDDGRGPQPASGPSSPPPAGPGPSSPPPAGHGLDGLRERADAAGGRLSVGRAAGGGFSLRLRMPDSVP